MPKLRKGAQNDALSLKFPQKRGPRHGTRCDTLAFQAGVWHGRHDFSCTRTIIKIQIPKPNSNNKAIPDCNLNSESLWIVLVFVSRGRSLWIKLFTSVPPTRLQSATTTASARYSLACTSAARARLWQSSLRLACRAPVAHLRPSPLSYEQIPQATP